MACDLGRRIAIFKASTEVKAVDCLVEDLN